jgi:hypothetical protein
MCGNVYRQTKNSVSVAKQPKVFVTVWWLKC